MDEVRLRGRGGAPAAVRRVRSAPEIAEVARLAREIWTEHYVPIIGPHQVEYMLDRFQSPDAIARQIADDGMQYFLIVAGEEPAGYLATQARGDRLFLSKIYVRRSDRGRGLAAASIEFVGEIARRQRCRTIELTVNRHNQLAIRFYERVGFQRSGELVTDIGRGFVMDDYVYELPVDAGGSPAAG
jgi:ribosomal protein S18 acetylase RimI-like enzyme